MNSKTSFDHARDLHQRGFAPIPVPPKAKKAILKGWTHLRLSIDDLSQHFTGGENIGVLLGEPSGWMVDIDLDHPLAEKYADEYLPRTGLEWGRESKPRSHRIYKVSAAIKTKKFESIGQGMIVEIRSTGCQTVAPGSTHPSGETVRWDTDGEASTIAPDELGRGVVALAQRVRRELGEPGTEKHVSSPRVPGASTATKPKRLDTTRYGKAAIDGEAEKVAHAVQGVRNDTLNRAAFSLGALVAGGEVGESEAMAALGQAAEVCGLDQLEAAKTIQSGLKAGEKYPRASPVKLAVLSSNGAEPGFSIDHHYLDSKGQARLTARFADEVLVMDTFNIGKEKARKQFCATVCNKRPELDPKAVADKLEHIAAGIPVVVANAKREEASVAGGKLALLAQADASTEKALKETDGESVRAAEEMLNDPSLTRRILADAEAMGVVGESDLVLQTYVLGTSRLLEQPLGAIVQGATSSGKTFVPEKIARLFPHEALLMATDITPNALYYAEPGALMHKFVVAGERPRRQDDERAEGTRALREMLGSGRLSKFVTVKAADGKMKSELVHQDGPIAYIESTTAAQIFDEDRNRCLLLGTDESAEQTARVVRSQAQRAVDTRTDLAPIAARHQAAQRMLRRVSVDIPFAPAIAAAIPTQRHEARRAMPMILNVVAAVALLYQRQRVSGSLCHGGRIAATLDDYAIARRLLVLPMGCALGGGLPEAVERFAVRITERYGSKCFSSTDAVRGDSVLHVKSKVNEYLHALADAGVVRCVAASRGGNPASYQVIAEVPKGGAIWLPSAEQLREGLS